MKPFLSLAAILTAYAVCFACFDPQAQFYSGVLFNDSESINISPILSMGQEGVNFITDCSAVPANGDSVGVIAAKPELSGKPFDKIVIDSAYINDNRLTLSVSYGGGCRQHSMVLYLIDTLKVSDTLELKMFLSHNSYNDPCKALIGQTLHFNLSSLFTMHNVSAAKAILLDIFSDTLASAKVTQAFWKPSKLCSITYRGHYDNNTMVHLGYYTPPLQPAMRVPRLLVCLDTTKVPTSSEKAAAVAAELQWLSAQGVIAISEPRITAIQQNLSITGGQYWTFEDTSLAYNMWFEYDSIAGKWKSGVSAINGVRGDCGADIQYVLPQDPLAFASISIGHLLKANPVSGKVIRQWGIYTVRGEKISSGNGIGHKGRSSGVFIVIDRMGNKRCVFSSAVKGIISRN